MAVRTVFLPAESMQVGVREINVNFTWYPGMAVSQAQKSILSLHQNAAEKGICNILEISSKSPDELGVALSAFNLKITTKKHGRIFSVESAFQGSKVFECGGPFIDLFEATSREAKRDVRLKQSGNLTGFSFYGMSFPLVPRTFFYDWIYCNALVQNESLIASLFDYDGFTDIVFNPEKSINCQAYSAALFVSLCRSGLLNEAMSSPEIFLDLVGREYKERSFNSKAQASLI
ncbi:DarT1-associated NADAR antitoxin family protein [Massilia oculi]|uniref:DarT1-associated NADAR antitoxin family protein n=1 Tax=Massilia oculi TaxID=945844 RepID=UPI0028AFFAAD|nr:hypothetical protein [Massilia oculi]